MEMPPQDRIGRRTRGEDPADAGRTGRRGHWGRRRGTGESLGSLVDGPFGLREQCGDELACGGCALRR
ncbi:hypothetical protein NDU88_004664 [Pleurodeles waltl]|uniref:Uncharacterized protein n=1 Tax=Pleurodeles waltl TaxID=8319 RepID=A0AAV7NK37_PLEWA|nr:hypothetical protein NDU88_004664 [Pleurodeles waltl]